VKALVLIAWLLSAAWSVRAADSNGSRVSFVRDVAPILAAKCLGCHNAEKAKGNYRLHTFDALLKPGDGEERPVVPGNPAMSRLHQLLVTADEDERMPQKDERLPAKQIATIRAWVEQGARFDGAQVSELMVVLAAPKHPPAPVSYPRPVPVTALAFDPSGERLATSGYHEIVVWDSTAAKVRQRIGGIAEKTLALTFSGDGRWMAAASGTPGRIGEVRLFHGTNGELAGVLAALPEAALCLAFNADGTRLAAGGADNVIRVWDVGSVKPSLIIEQHADWVLDIAFSPDGKHFVSASRDKSARIFNARSGELEETYTGHGDFIIGVAWATPKTVNSIPRTGAAHRWNAENTKRLGDFSGWQAGPTRIVSDATNLFVATMDGQVRHYTARSNEFVRVLKGTDAIQSLALHPSSGRIAAGAHDGEVSVWRTADGEILGRFIAAPGYSEKLSRSP
jgi:hypothetical protein